MKQFSKVLLVAAMAATATGVAEARISTASDADARGSENVLAMANLTKEVSYLLDLGVFTREFDYNAPFSRAINTTDVAFNTFIGSYAAGDNVVWGFSSTYSLLNAIEDIPLTGYYGTKETAADPGFSGWAQAGGAFDTMISGNQSADTDNSINPSSFRTKGQIGYIGDFGKNGGGNAAYNIFGDLGNTVAFVHDGLQGDTGLDAKWTILGTADFSLTSNSALLTFTPTAVPLPAAVWMFGAGLMGVLRLNRRKSVAA